MNTRQQLYFSFPEFRYSLLEFNFRKNCQHLTNFNNKMPNKRDKVWRSATSLFTWRFRSRRRRCCLSSLKGHLKKVTSRWFKLYWAYFISLLKFVKCWQFFLESNSKILYRSTGKEKESSLVFKSSTKREIMHFHVVVVQWRERYLQKSVMHVQSCCFANLSQLLFCRSSWRLCRRCLNALLISQSF